MLRLLWMLAALYALQPAQVVLAQATYESFGRSLNTDDLEEVEDLPALSEPLSAAVQTAPIDLAGSWSEELRYSQEELRNRYSYFIGATLGHVRPWQGYSLEMGVIWAKDKVASLCVGGGSFEESGFLEEQAYDIKSKTRSMAATLRWYSSHFPHLALEGVLGYVTWEGRMDPKGSDSEEVETDASRLSSGFRALGMTLGGAMAVTWIWDNGMVLDWTPVGIQLSRMHQKDYDRETDLLERAVKYAVERPAFYGMINLKLGYVF